MRWTGITIICSGPIQFHLPRDIKGIKRRLHKRNQC